MTDYTDLIARLRDNPIENEEAHEAAALESQAKRIAELEERAALLDEHLSQAIGNLKKRDARIEELKKENEDLVLKGLALILLVPDGTKLEEIQKSYERVAAMPARIAELEAALKEVHRRTGLLMTQNQGRWNMSLEHDRRTADVLSVNQDISSAALENKHD